MQSLLQWSSLRPISPEPSNLFANFLFVAPQVWLWNYDAPSSQLPFIFCARAGSLRDKKTYMHNIWILVACVVLKLALLDKYHKDSPAVLLHSPHSTRNVHHVCTATP